MSEEIVRLLSKISVLIAEDDDIAREILSSGLKPYCKAVYTAVDGADGLDKFAKFNADIILTDIHMPTMNGFEMMKNILKFKPHQQFIIFTSFDTDTNLLKSLQAGATLFLKKPIDIEELRKSIATLAYKREEKLIKINDEISLNLSEEKIYKNGEEVYLSFLQNKFLWLLAYNLNRLVSYDMIEEFVYERQNVSKSAIQNMVLRLKKEINIKIKNISESGYILTGES